MITIIDKYISRSFLLFFALGLLSFVFLFFVVDFVVSTSRFDADLSIFVVYYSYYVLEIAQKLIPVACLMATVFTVSQLSSNSELIAIQTMGWSLYRISLPILLLVSSISVFSFVISNELMTKVSDEKNKIYYSELKKKPWLYTTSRQEKIWYRSGQNIFNIGLLNSEQKKAFDVSVFTFSPDWTLQQILKAKEADITDGEWTLKYGQITVHYDEQSPPIYQPFEERVLVMGEEIIDIKVSSKASAAMGVGELGRYIRKNKEAGMNTTSFEVDYHSKFSYMITALVMALIGIPFSFSNSRSGGILVNMQICLVLTFVYWAFYSSGLTLGRYGTVSPMMAAWGPNLIVGGAALFLIHQRQKV